MKKIGLFLLAFLMTMASFDVFAREGITLVWGHVNKENVQALSIYQVIEGKKVEYASTNLDAHNNFGFALPSVKPGFYYLSGLAKNEYTRIYLKSGEKLELQLNEDGYEVKQGSKENKVLQDWFAKSYVITNPSFNWMKQSSDYTTFFPKLEAFVPQVPAFKASIKTSNPHFNNLMKMAVDVDVENAAMYFLITPHTIHPAKGQYPSFYKGIVQPGKYKNASLLELGEGVDLLVRYSTFYWLYTADSSTKRPDSWLQFNASLIGNDTLKGAYIANSLRFKSYDDLEKNVEPLKHYLVTDSMQAVYLRVVKSLAGFKKGTPGLNFSYEDMTGKKVAMNDLKGKVVVVDVWATWCAPCKKEIPYLKQLEEEFKGKDIEFVSISVDAEKDKEKWRDMVTKDQLGGTQLFAGTGKEISKFYNISAIPRFLVFDQQGKIVSVDAPRPSEPELKKMLEATLDQK